MDKPKDIQIFNNPQFGKIRTIEIEGRTYFVASDVAKALGYVKPQNAIAAHCRGALKRGIGVQTGKKANGEPAMQTIQMNVIPEGDVYRLAANSELATAREFESWVFDEVLPTINKHGAYLTPQKIEEALLNPDTIIKLATSLKQEREKRIEAEETIKIQQPKVDFADAVASTTGCVSMAALAKMIKQSGYDMGRDRLFSWMREKGYLIQKKGRDYNSPTQASLNAGVLKGKVTTMNLKNGSYTSVTPMVTGKGQIYFVKLFQKMGATGNGKY